VARDQAREIRAAVGAALVDAVLADEAFVAWIADTEIQRRIATGELLSRDALMVGGALELHPVGIVSELRAMLATLAQHPKVKAIPELADQVTLALALANPQASVTVAATAPSKRARTKKSSGGAPEAEVSAPGPHETGTSAPAADDEPGRPKGMPVGPQICEACGCDVSEEAARWSYTAKRRILCGEDLKKSRAA
jgi:hypothetical protein